MSETDDPERKWTEGIDPALTCPFTREDVAMLRGIFHRDECEAVGSWDMSAPCACEQSPEIAALRALADRIAAHLSA